MKFKKGSGFPIEVVAVALLILIVLIVVLIAFHGGFSNLFGSISKLIKDVLGLSDSIDVSNIVK
jgi:hypothetical protein